MAIEATHPLYDDRIEDWEQLQHTHDGERAVKSQGTKYLPATSGMLADGMETGQKGREAYTAYVKRAVFHDFVADTVEGLVGIMHREPPRIELPAKLEPLRERATVSGESLELLLRRINEAQILKGRYGMTLDAPDGAPAGALPFIATYVAETIRNWSTTRPFNGPEELEFVVLDESAPRLTSELTWEHQDQYRVLVKTTTLEQLGVNVDGLGPYAVAVLKTGKNLNEGEYMTPSIAGAVLEDVPFVFINTGDLVSAPDRPPLLGLSNLSLAVYRGEADYRQSLFMQGQDTLVVIGDEDDDPQEEGGEQKRVGAGSSLSIPMGGDAKFIGVSSSGLSEQRQALENDKLKASQASVQMMDTGSSSQQSGEALRIRVAARTATLTNIAQTGAEALAQILRQAAVWVGANPDEVVVEPNTDFAEDTMTGQDLMQFTQAKNQGAPISWRSIHRAMQKRDLTDMDYEEEMDEISEEGPTGGDSGLGVPGEDEA